MTQAGPSLHSGETEEIDLQFASRIRLTREAAGMSQTVLAERMGVSAQAVLKWEAGSSFPRLSRLYQLARVLGVRLSFLLPDDSEAAKSLDAIDIRIQSLAQRVLALPEEKRRALSIILDVTLN